MALAGTLAPSLGALLDEPFSALDEQFRRPLRRAFRHCSAGRRQTCVLVTHDPRNGRAGRPGGGDEGRRILQQDSPAALLASPRTEEVAAFLGCFNCVDL